MASGSLLALLDDIATLLDDVSVMTKVAAKKTAGVLGDDLAVNAEQVSGVRAERELPVVWAVAKGSMINKVFIVPAVLLLSAFLPWLITPLLIVGGLYLCFEGAEKVWHSWILKEKNHSSSEALLANSEADLRELEKEKIKGAIRTDFILSLEIIVIALSTMASQPIEKQALGLSVVAIAMTIFIYGLVAIIVKIDDAGLYLSKKEALLQKLGDFLLWFAPVLMKGLTLVGTIAMFLVGGGILSHSLEHYAGHDFAMSALISFDPSWLAVVTQTLANGVIGLIAGAILVLLISKIIPHGEH